MFNAKKPSPHHHDMQGKTILAFRRIVQKESVFYPYYTVEHMRGRVKTATKKAILQQIVEPQWDQFSPSQQESICSLLEAIER